MVAVEVEVDDVEQARRLGERDGSGKEAEFHLANFLVGAGRVLVEFPVRDAVSHREKPVPAVRRDGDAVWPFVLGRQYAHPDPLGDVCHSGLGIEPHHVYLVVALGGDVDVVSLRARDTGGGSEQEEKGGGF